MSPDQAEGKPVDSRSDIFSFGVVMYEALTGERPFKGDSYASLVSEVLNKDPRPITELKPQTPFLLGRLVTRCLAKDRRRFQSMRGVRVILEEMKAAADAGISLDSGSVPHSSAAGNSFRKWLFAALVTMVVVLGGFSVYRYFLNRASPAAIGFANMTLRRLSQSKDVVYAHVTPDGRSIAYNTIHTDEGRSLWIRRIEDKNALQLLPSQPVFFWGGLAVAPDGSQIYYITAERNDRYALPGILARRPAAQTGRKGQRSRLAFAGRRACALRPPSQRRKENTAAFGRLRRRQRRTAGLHARRQFYNPRPAVRERRQKHFFQQARKDQRRRILVAGGNSGRGRRGGSGKNHSDAAQTENQRDLRSPGRPRFDHQRL
jgi:hypothetical protein